MRRFYLAYADRAGGIAQTVSGQLEAMTIPQTPSEESDTLATVPRPFTLGWSHYVFLLGVKNLDERGFYEIEATSQGWTVRELRGSSTPAFTNVSRSAATKRASVGSPVKAKSSRSQPT